MNTKLQKNIKTFSKKVKTFFKNVKAFKKNALVFWMKRQGLLMQMTWCLTLFLEFVENLPNLQRVYKCLAIRTLMWQILCNVADYLPLYLVEHLDVTGQVADVADMVAKSC